ncbi:MAG: hypothetical protein HY063_04910 [Bacteroidetes bacterium]|nr:hypothetical protein [Bacteroidota bacterium]
MEERDGVLVHYDAATQTASVTDSYTGGNISVNDIGGIGAAPNPPIPDGSTISFIINFIPPRGAEGASKIVAILKGVKA